MRVRTYPEIHAPSRRGIFDDLAKMISDRDINKAAIAIYFREYIRFLQGAQQLCGRPVDPKRYSRSTLTPPAGIWNKPRAEYGLYWTRVSSEGSNATLELRVVLVESRSDEQNCIDSTVKRHNDIGAWA